MLLPVSPCQSISAPPSRMRATDHKPSKKHDEVPVPSSPVVHAWGTPVQKNRYQRRSQTE
ncbi:hypothetical protein [Xylella fastidiosa]|uniref:hypothetical protein n=1 Tax=Xylella fastidiosa TaxID=2371 RepID=UPI002416559E|nr:hypothetical protein [Xylella fastidiosa]MDG4872831.1 hypothetical protein [Xylella fastidiosa subsp. multiplex]